MIPHNHCIEMFGPHGSCWGGDGLLVWLHTLSDSVIALSYFAIPAALFYLARKHQVKRISSVFTVYGLFIFGCGLTHVFDVLTVWRANYWIYLADGIVRALTGVVSVAAAIVTVRCAKDVLVAFARLSVLERRMAKRVNDLETIPRYDTEGDRRWAGTLRELNGIVQRVVAYAPPNTGEEG